jgi:excisionase family DNA binding protein
MMTKELKPQRFLATTEAASLCGVTRNTICAWIRDGRLTSYQTVGGKNLIRPSELVTFMEKHRMFVPGELRTIIQDDVAAEAAAPPAAPPVSFEKSPAVLVADDMPEARRLAMACLRQLELPILEAASGYEALHLLLQHPEISVVVLDIVMPGQLGTQTLQEIRQQHPHVKVIIATAYGLDNAMDMLRECPPDSILIKPYKPVDLVQSVRVLLPA